jgi:L-rhamnose-H+ transport protein
VWSWLGVTAAGLLNGSFAVPMKTARTWKFHHIWTLHSLLAMVVLPWAVAIYTVPSLSEILGSVPARGWLVLALLGLLFGVGSLLYGVAVDLLGIALGFAIQLGLSVVLGALELRLMSGSISFRTARDAAYLLGLVLMVVGVILCALAGGAKSAQPGAVGAKFRKGLVIAIVGGVLAPSLGLGIEYGTKLLAPSRTAGALGDSFNNQTYLAWAVFLSVSAVVQGGYCLYRVARERATSVFVSPGAALDALQVVGMSTLWISSIYIYGRSVFSLGGLGASLGWPIFIAFIILTSNAWGVILGEWKGAARRSFRRMLVGSAVLVLAAFLIGRGNPGS